MKRITILSVALCLLTLRGSGQEPGRCRPQGPADHRSLDRPAQGGEEGRGQSHAAGGYEFRGAVAGHQGSEPLQRGTDHPEHEDEQCPFLPGAGRGCLFHGELALHAGQGVQGLYVQHLQAREEKSLLSHGIMRMPT